MDSPPPNNFENDQAREIKDERRSPPRMDQQAMGRSNNEQKNSTVYVQNLNEKVHLVELKNSLFQLFSNMGVDVLEVHAKRNIKMRGQAFVVCADEEQSESAIQQLQGNNFYGKPLKLSYAKHVSDVIAKMKGTFEEGVKVKRKEELKKSERNREVKQKKKMIQKLYILRRQIEAGPGEFYPVNMMPPGGKMGDMPPGGQMQQGPAPVGHGAPPGNAPPHGPPPHFAGGPPPHPQGPMHQDHGSGGPPSHHGGMPALSQAPRHTLFVSDMPKDVDISALNQLFNQFPGLKEIRFVKEKGVAFIEFENDQFAGIVLDQLKSTGMLEREIARGVKVKGHGW